tara:strand:- start:191 stop:706 length:516 start_codon:yes stop_codon:yes gene_type:complete
MPSTKNIQKVEELTLCFSKAKAIYFTEYHGLDVGKITELRSMFFKEGVEYKVAKNTLIRLALLNNKIENLDKVLSGSTAMAISYDEPVIPAKIIKNFTNDNGLPHVKGILFDGEYFPGEKIKELADLPSKDQLLVKFAMMLKSPMFKIASTLNAPMQNIVGLLNSLKQNKS